MTDLLSVERNDAGEPDRPTFLCARFAGGRFDNHVIPFDILPDLAAYRALLIEIAKMLFRQNHAKSRVPKGFEESFQLGLSRIDGGSSAVAYAVRLSTGSGNAQSELGFAKYQEFEEAQTYLENLLIEVQTTGKVPENFTPELADRFNPFGQNLREDEYVELNYGGAAPIRYDNRIRKRIVLSREKTYESSVDSIFTLNGGLLDAAVIHVRDEGGTKFDFRASSDLEFETAYSRPGQKVRLIGTGSFDNLDKLKRLNEVTVVYGEGEPRLPFEERLDEIASAEDGWYSGDNPAPRPLAIQSMRNFVRTAIQLIGTPDPYLYPLPDGGVCAEWSLDDWEANVDIGGDGEFLSFHASNVESLSELEREIEFVEGKWEKEFESIWNVLMELRGQ